VLLQVVEHRLPEGETLRLDVASRVVYELDRDDAEYSGGARTISGPTHALAFELVRVPSERALLSAPLRVGRGEQLIRCDRVDFPPGGVAYLHTHQGPGIRVLLNGAIRIETAGQAHTYEPLEAWFEPGPEPVFAAASDTEPTAFVRCLVLPAELRGRSSIRYVREEDVEKPKSQHYTVFVDHLVGAV
jgi:quercetin dioxygenase-like cupin family protein